MTADEREYKEQRIRDLTADLAASVSSIGDWKHIKQTEYAARGLDQPYTDDEMETYYAARQAARDEINALQEELEADE